MKSGNYKQRDVGGRQLRPETLMMGYGFSPALSEGSLKPPMFLTSTFVFESAQQGKDFFDITSGRRPAREGEEAGLVYSRFNNPNFEILEDRLAVWDEAERGAVFSSGMAAIATTVLTFVGPGEVVLHSRPLYGGTETLVRSTLSALGIPSAGFTDGLDRGDVTNAAEEAMALGPVGVIFVETPANPTSGVVDLSLMADVADLIAQRQGRRPVVVCDHTLLGPMFQQPLRHRADLAVYSLTKYAGGHSDLVAGGLTGSADLVGRVDRTRGAIGTQLDPHSSWLLLRSLETLHIRAERACRNARRLAEFLAGPKWTISGSSSPAIRPGQCSTGKPPRRDRPSRSTSRAGKPVRSPSWSGCGSANWP
ncbi:aminotransferase class I/II-fold pyridoxal phosphate-dependent enzyme [Amycolatopsis carbonis]|uniref:homocysteine desulfhydrase n=1 Tax=Amycolatopsis carbonis TaxID=715471 RepID=A0A9Y2MUA4_9PSEU|nr:aminotransferase class I/II-fold pyridoxal phosphate-dependent enzyme [Amycolatopsis sp. 2-15]WIX75462.1 aminotransferase class I/II-fold pyridoxal phosphate-dependent enzyme [Amycolatopsis sp. 2-15]